MLHCSEHTKKKAWSKRKDVTKNRDKMGTVGVRFGISYGSQAQLKNELMLKAL